MYRENFFLGLEDRVYLSATHTVETVWQDQTVSVFQDSWLVSTEIGSDAFQWFNGLDQRKQVGDLDAFQILESDALGLGVFELTIEGESDVQTLSQGFSILEGINYLEPNFELASLGIPGDPSFDSLWGLHNTGQTSGTPDADIDAPEAWDLHQGDGQVIVAVIDSGVDYTHPDLAGNIWFNPGEIAGDGIDNDGNGYVDDVHGYDFINDDGDPMDDHRHGTHVAGTIGAVGNNSTGVVGVNPNVQIMALKFLGASGSGSTADAIEAVNYLTMMKRDFGIDIRLSNNSWGGGSQSQAMQDAIESNLDQDILFVASAGNKGTDNDQTVRYPSGYPIDNIVAVAATDHDDQLAGFSNYGQTKVHLAAPGVSINSTLPNSEYGYLSGTSMAAPHVSGALSLLMSASPGLSGMAAKSILLDTVDELSQLDGVVSSGGRLNVHNMLLSALIDEPGPQAPVSISLSGSLVQENDAGATIGTLAAFDPDVGDTHVFSASHADLIVTGHTLKLRDGVSLDYEVTAQIATDITATDTDGLSVTRNFVIDVLDVDSPVVVAPSVVEAHVAFGGQSSRNFQLKNTGLSALDYSVRLEDISGLVSQSVSWASLPQMAGHLLPGQTEILNIDFDTSVLAHEGAYEASIILETAQDPEVLTIPIRLLTNSTVDLVVDTLVDENDGDFSVGDLSLREAIEISNLAFGTQTVTFDDSVFTGGQTITLSGSHIEIDDDVFVRGLDGEGITIDADSLSRHFEISNVDVSISDLVLQNGYVIGGEAAGSILIQDSTVTLNNMSFFDNGTFSTGSVSGGAIRSFHSDLSVINSTFSGNISGRDGGAILLYFSDFYGLNSTFSNNLANNRGGGIGVFNSTVTLENTTFTGNEAKRGGGTFKGSASTLVMNHSIVAGNTSPDGNDIGGINITSGRFNLIGDAASSGGLLDGVDGNIIGLSGAGIRDVGSILDTTLRDNGAPTKTHALLPGSVAIDSGDRTLLPLDSFDLDSDGDLFESLPMDQRGLNRVFNNQVDIGAYELDMALVVNGDDDGPGSLRAAIEAVNGNPSISTIRILDEVTSIELASSLIYTGSQSLLIEGNQVNVRPLLEQEGLFNLFVSQSAADITLMDMTIEDGASGVVVEVPDLSTGTVALFLINTLVQNNALFGVHMNDKAFDSDAGLHFLSFASQFVSNGNGAQDYDGVRIDEGGLGDARTDITTSAFALNGGDGLEVDETGDGQVATIISDSFFQQNGFFNPADLDDGIDVDEAGEGGVFIDIANTTINGNADEGLDIDEAGLGSAAINLTDVWANFNQDEGVKVDEAGDGDLVVAMLRVESNQSAGEAGIALTESGAGLLHVIGDTVTADGNAKAGIAIKEVDAGHLYVQMQTVSTQFNGGDGFAAEENDAGDLQGAMVNLTTVGNGGFGVNLIQAQAGGDLGQFLLYYLAFVNTSGPLSATNVTVSP